MIIYTKKEELINLLLDEIRAWEHVGGGPNLHAFEFKRDEIDPRELERLGYYNNPESWISGIRIAALHKFLQEVQEAPIAGVKT